VPTWNYEVVHAHGRIRIRDDATFVRGVVARLTREHETAEPRPWKMGDAPADYLAEDNIIAGNVILFGATSGQAFISGQVGERFAVRNSGAHAVVEGVGDHGCEYMTGGKIAILGPIGRNFAAGMSGGMAYVYDPDGSLEANLNAEMVQLEGLDDEDLEWLQAMLQAHIDATDSAVAQRIMNDWNNNVKHFTKVMPRDYKRVLEAVAEAKASGATGSAIDEAIMAAAGA
jgi:glutamate synthase domain-containing protein 3